MTVTCAGLWRCARCGECYILERFDDDIDAPNEFCNTCVEILVEGLVLCPTEERLTQ